MAVKMSQPKGGVAEPIATCIVTTVPTSTGSTPACAAAGAKIGVRIRITTMGSTNMQPTKVATAIENSTWSSPEPSSRPKTPSTSRRGSSAYDTTHENA